MRRPMIFTAALLAVTIPVATAMAHAVSDRNKAWLGSRSNRRFRRLSEH